MAVQAQPKIMGLNDIRLRRGTTIVQLDAAQQMTITDMVVSGTLRGSGKIVSVVSYNEGAEVALQAGGLPVEAFPVLFGFSLPAATGSSPNEVRTIEIPASRAFGYFEAKGRSLGDDGGDVIIYVPKIQLTSGITITMQDGANFTAPEMSGIALPQAGTTYDRAYDIRVQETSAPISYVTLTLSDIDVASNIATATTTSTASMAAGQYWYIAGATSSHINGLKQIITVASGTTFTFAAIGANTTNETGTASR